MARILLQLCLMALVASMVLAMPQGGEGKGKGNGKGKHGEPREDVRDSEKFGQLDEETQQKVLDLVDRIRALDRETDRDLIQELRGDLKALLGKSKRSPPNMEDFDVEKFLSQLPEDVEPEIRRLYEQLAALGDDQQEERWQIQGQIHEILKDLPEQAAPSKRFANGSRDGNGGPRNGGPGNGGPGNGGPGNGGPGNGGPGNGERGNGGRGNGGPGNGGSGNGERGNGGRGNGGPGNGGPGNGGPGNGGRGNGGRGNGGPGNGGPGNGAPSKRFTNGNRDGNGGPGNGGPGNGGPGNGGPGNGGAGNGNGHGHKIDKETLLSKLPEPYKSEVAELFSEMESMSETEDRKAKMQEIRNKVSEYRATQE